MNNPQEQHIELIIRYLSGESDNTEKTLLQQWINESEENKKLFEQYESIWKIDPVEQKDITTDTESAWRSIENKIALEESKPAVPNTVSFWSKNKSVFYAISGIAALFLIFIGLTYLLPGQKQQWAIHETNQRTVEPFLLDDGTEIYFNGKSRLEYPETFSNNERLIRFSGKAFFDVAHEPDKKFVIQIGENSIEVLGTSFYVEHTMDGEIVNNFQVDVVSGSVKVSGAINEIVLNKNESASINTQTGEVEKHQIDDLNFIAWKTGILEFKETPLSEVFHILEETYNITVMAPGTVSAQKLTATFENEKPTDIFKTISLLFEFNIENQEGDTFLIRDSQNN